MADIPANFDLRELSDNSVNTPHLKYTRHDYACVIHMCESSIYDSYVLSVIHMCDINKPHLRYTRHDYVCVIHMRESSICVTSMHLTYIQASIIRVIYSYV